MSLIIDKWYHLYYDEGVEPVAELLPESDSNLHSNPGTPRTRELVIHALEQQLAELEEVRYEALREMRDATRRAAELGLQSLEVRMRLCALIEYEPLQRKECAGVGARAVAVRLTHLYFDDPTKYRLALFPREQERAEAPLGEGDPLWCSEVVYDSTRPEGKSTASIADAVRKAYRAADARGYRVVWATAR